MNYNDEIYDQIKITEPVIDELIKSQSLQRLKGIRSNGVNYYFDSRSDQTRFEHSLGVYYILNRFEAPLEEQVAGLLHDISHQVFSHVMDFFHDTGLAQDHQDSIHHTLFKSGEVKEIILKYDMDPERISNLELWSMLDNELPDICADRLDYTFRDAFQLGFIDIPTTNEILSDLFFNKEKGFIFSDLKLARIFGNLSLKMQLEGWHTYSSETAFAIMAEILKYAKGKNYLKDEDFWLTDDAMVEKLLSFSDEFINEKFNELKNLKGKTKENYPISKFRVVDPWIGNKRLSQIDSDFKKKYYETKEKI